ncbi:MAG: ABC transporter substrate-binding protein [Carbonactinosporaceae bacterium]
MMDTRGRRTADSAALSRRGFLGAAGAATAGLAAPGLAGCATAPDEGGGQSKGNGEVTIYWNAGHVYDAYTKVIEDFEKDHGVTVQWQKFQWPDMLTKLTADFSAGNVPDLVEEPGGWVVQFALTGDVLSLQPYLEKDGPAMGFPDDWLPFTVEHNTVDGEVFGIQQHLTCLLHFYNKAMFAKAGISGPPTTWDEFLETAKALTGDGVHGVALNALAFYGWPWLLQDGVSYFDPATKEVMVPRGAAVEGLQFQVDLVHKHKVSPVPVVTPDYSTPRKLMAAERAAMMISGPWDLAPLREASPDLDFGIHQALSSERQATAASGTSLFIPKKAKNPDLAWDLIKRITAVDVELAVTEEADMTMPRKSWARNEAVRSNPTLNAFAQGLEYSIDWMEDLARSGARGPVDETWISTYEQILIQGKPVEETLRTFSASAQKALSQ